MIEYFFDRTFNLGSEISSLTPKDQMTSKKVNTVHSYDLLRIRFGYLTKKGAGDKIYDYIDR